MPTDARTLHGMWPQPHQRLVGWTLEQLPREGRPFEDRAVEHAEQEKHLSTSYLWPWTCTHVLEQWLKWR